MEIFCHEKSTSGHILMHMKSRCKNTSLFEKRPELLQQTTGTMYFKAWYKFFFGIFEKNLIRHKHCPQSDHSKLFFCEKSLSKKFDNKNGKKNCQNRKLKINIFLQKNLKNGHFEAKAYGESKKF